MADQPARMHMSVSAARGAPGCALLLILGVCSAHVHPPHPYMCALQGAYLAISLNRMSEAVTAAFPGGARTLPSPADVQKCIGCVHTKTGLNVALHAPTIAWGAHKVEAGARWRGCARAAVGQRCASTLVMLWGYGAREEVTATTWVVKDALCTCTITWVVRDALW